MKKKFLFFGIVLVFFNLLCMFMYAGMQVEHMNIIQTFITEDGGGWNANLTMLPMTIGNIAAIILTIVYGTLLIKFGIKKIMIPFMALTGLGCVGIALANGLDCFGGTKAGNFPLFFIALFVIRCCCPIFQMGGAMLITNWFIRLRGRMASIGSIGATIFTIVGTSLMPNVISKQWNGDYRPFYYGVAVLTLLMILILVFLLKDVPEDAGLYPDGMDHSPLSEIGDNTPIKASKMLRDKKLWQLTIVMIAPQFVLPAIMSSMAISFMTLGGSELWLAATAFLSVGAIGGIPCSLAFGWLNDKLGSLKAEMIFILSMLIPTLSLIFMPVKKSVILLSIMAIGLAIILGAAPVMGPCIVAYVYGRKQYQAANRLAFAMSLIPAAFSGIMMTSLIQSGHAKIAYLILIIIIAISFTALMTMRKLPDANAADRS
ncbi:MAG: MFS transporter [Parasporobacterium sp.]|nr:MFS transporter [Parasporobacterium sp.]